MFYDKYIALCEKKSISPSKAAEEIGFNKSSITNWKNNGYTPRKEILIKVANYFNVSIDYLLNSGESEKKEPAVIDRFSHDYYLLDDEDKKAVDALVSALLSNSKYKKENVG